MIILVQMSSHLIGICEGGPRYDYRQTSNISHTLVDNKIVDPWDGVGASRVCAAPTTSSFSI